MISIHCFVLIACQHACVDITKHQVSNFASSQQNFFLTELDNLATVVEQFIY